VIIEEESVPFAASGAAVLGLGSAVPEPSVEQGAAAEAVIDLAGLDGARAAWTRRIFAKAGVDRRRTVLPELAAGRPPFGGERRPGTAARMALYRKHAGPLAAAAAARALAAAGIAAPAVTHVVVVTCTGFHAPGVDVELVGLLGLRPDVDRTVVGFMGCHGAFAGLRSARRAVHADPSAVALVVCVELCSLHVRADATPDALVASSLFGDGAAAAVVGADRPRREVLLALGPAESRVEPGTGPMMGWAVGDDGFEMTLGADIPVRIGGAIAGFAGRLAPRGEVDAWCVHPGGPAVLSAAETALGLAPDALDHSRSVLRDYGNVSSATILFVLERAAAGMAAGTRGVALGFGPGLTFEGFGFRRGGAPCRPASVAAAAAGASA
jgi:predicted naringenin-chalcone synthase